MCCSYNHQEKAHAKGAVTYPPDDALYCGCKGDNPTEMTGCCGAKTSDEDGLCDRCREHCKQPTAIQVMATEALYEQAS